MLSTAFSDVARDTCGLGHRRFGLLRTRVLDIARGSEQGFESPWGHVPLRMRKGLLAIGAPGFNNAQGWIWPCVW